MIRCDEEHGKIKITTDDRDAELDKLAGALYGSRWEEQFRSTGKQGEFLVFIAQDVSAAMDDDVSNEFVDLVGLEPGDDMRHGYAPEDLRDLDDEEEF